MPEEEVQQDGLFDTDEFTTWKQEWVDMPDYDNRDLQPWKNLIVSFASRADMQAFAELVGQTLTDKTQSIWYPKAEIDRMVTKRYVQRDEPQ